MRSSSILTGEHHRLHATALAVLRLSHTPTALRRRMMGAAGASAGWGTSVHGAAVATVRASKEVTAAVVSGDLSKEELKKGTVEAGAFLQEKG